MIASLNIVVILDNACSSHDGTGFRVSFVIAKSLKNMNPTLFVINYFDLFQLDYWYYRLSLIPKRAHIYAVA